MMNFYVGFNIYFAVWFILILAGVAQGKPYLAVKYGMTCVKCHYSPYGSGPRNNIGKALGLRTNASFEALNFQNLSLDARLLFNGGIRSRQDVGIGAGAGQTGAGGVGGGGGKGRMGFMSVIPALHSSNLMSDLLGYPLGGVLSGDVGGFRNGLREGYLVWGNEEGLIHQVLIGRFTQGFGILNDDHRSFIRLINKTTFRDQVQGIAVFGEIPSLLNFDLSLGDGIHGDRVANNSLHQSVYTLNIKSQMGPNGFLGVSHQSLTPKEGRDFATASSLYTGLNIQNLTSLPLPLTLLAEVAQSHGWLHGDLNDHLGIYMIPSATILESLSPQTQSYASTLYYHFNDKLDFFVGSEGTDIGKDADLWSFKKNLLGALWSPFASVNLIAQYESLSLLPPSLYSLYSKQGSATTLIVHAWF